MYNILKYINGDATTFPEGILIHQVNSQGKMYSGIAKSIREKFPTAYDKYINQYKIQSNKLYLGQVIPAIIDDSRSIGNLVSQDSYGYNGDQYTSYAAIEVCLLNLVKKYDAGMLGEVKPIIHSPLIGCGLGGGDWDIVSQIILKTIPEKFEINIWKFD